MDFSPEQQRAADSFLSWFESRPTPGGVYRLFGYAGTGKTTIAKTIAEQIEGQVIFAAFTGKAALVLNAKGCYGARTIHSLIYIPREKCASTLTALKEKLELEQDPDKRRELQTLYALERENLKRPAFNLNLESELRGASLLVLDEVSMVDMQIGQDLLSFECPILALGDPAQLPPVRGCGFFTQADPDYLLTEIHRQAAGSPILGMATHVRQGGKLSYGGPQEALVVPRGTLKAHDLAKFDQVICGMNKTRRTINSHIRTQVMGVESPLPVIGDRIVCLRNDSDTGLLNGSQWDVNGVEQDPTDENKLILSIAAAGEKEAYTFQVTAHRQFFLGTEDEIPHYEMREAQSFDYAYALTCHKAQGSQWDKVAIVNESAVFRHDAARWLYTAVTRAAEQVTVIQ
jgi:Mesyanzhinovviridae Dda-like helicase